MKEHNKRGTFRMGVNQFSDLTFKELYRLNSDSGDVVRKTKMDPFAVKYKTIKLNPGVKIPKAFDWRDRSAILTEELRDQGLCGSCYAHASMQLLETQLALRFNKTVKLSVQEILDCAGDYGTFNCHGGFIEGVFSYINAVGGISLEEDYPQTEEVKRCRANIKRLKMSIKAIWKISNRDEEDLKAALFLYGPLFVAFDHLHDSFFRYSSGIYNEPRCEESQELSHVALIIGYGREKEVDFWVIKNSYGSTWGEQGHMRIARNKNNHCKVGLYVGIPDVDLE